ncbi:MAG TPA: ABC transporter permease [Bryobacteraceae bacterium]
MSSGYAISQAELDAATRTVHVEFTVRNDSREPWRVSEGFAVSYHLYDVETGTLIADGSRVHPPADVQPGESLPVALDIAVPPEDGRYQVVLSPMREGVCWYYEKGLPFLLVEAATENAVTSLRRVRVATNATLRRERTWRAIGRAFVYPVMTIWRNRGLIRVMVRRDVLGRYRGSFGGSFWTAINPLLLMLTYFFVFGIVLHRAGESRTQFAITFLAGMLPWLAFSEAVGRSPTVMLEHRNFVKKLVFAVETVPVNLVVSGLVTELCAVVLFSLLLVAIGHGLAPSVLWLPVLLVPQLLFTAGVSWFLAALGVFVRDLGQIIGYILTVWFFITPICYPESSLGPSATLVLSKNPIYVLVRGYRAIFLDNHAPVFGPLWKLWLLSVVVFVLGHAWFYKLRKSFADII